MSDYTYPGASTLKNRFGVTDPDDLERVESAYVEARRIEIDDGHGPKGAFDAEHLKALHQHLFQDVYEWAGRTRDERVTLSDGSTAIEPLMRKAGGQPFAVGPEIGARLDAFSAQLRDADYLRGLPREAFAERAADTMAELNGIHPFREGNGRTQRVFMEQLAEAAGHNLDFTVVSKERMTQASIEAHENGDPSMMRRMFDEISDPERSAMLRGSIEQLERLKFNWNDRYVATLTPDHGVNLVMAGIAGDEFMARTESAIFFGHTADLPDPRPERGEAFRYGEARESVGEEVDATRSFPTASEGLETAVHVTEAVLDIVLDYGERTIDFLAESFSGLFGGASPPAPSYRPPPAADRSPVVENNATRKAEDERSQRRAQYLRDFDQEIPDELQQDAELSRGRGRGRTRGD